MSANKQIPLTNDQVLRSNDRAYIILFVWMIVALFIIGRAFYVQVIKHTYYVSLGSKQYVSSVPINFDRGTIFFSNYKKTPVPVAQLRTTYRIAIDPTQIENPLTTYTTLSKYISLDKDTFIERASKKNDPYEEIAKGVDTDVVTLLKSKKIKGVSFYRDNERSYPQENVGAKVIGFVGNNGDRVKGQYGLERYYEDILTRSSDDKTVNFFAELFTDIEKTIVSNVDKEEGDIILTIDAEAQRVLHATLIDTQKTWKSDIIGGIIMDPKTGAIIAMDSLPSFNPNKFQHVKDASFFVNQNVSGVYEMGSIIKPITMASAIDAGAVDETKTTYNDTGFRDLNGYKVRNFDGRSRGKNTSMQAILDQSLNVGTVFLVEQLGTKRFQNYFKKFGIGSETGIDLPGEAGGLTKNIESNVLVDSATAGFGQGIAITPIQTIRALAVLGNGGKLVTPHVVDSIVYQNGDRKKLTGDESQFEQVISPETSERISRMLVHVVDTALMHGKDKMEHYSIAAKTGTAQMVEPGKGYYEDRYLHSFFGYFPAYEPKYIIFLFHTNPKGAEYASATLTDPFFKLVKFLISYYEVPPDR
ncbi:MAG: penicillin-binding protein 2 [Candidatus Pacebacteria bacterium]|nr:penicillin-binding protein 2 [Candidatus Paceibacterota bacterium]MBP9866656.1 penicillin-binding protein 2 [Candidatus Paceibacterota bacterium]